MPHPTIATLTYLGMALTQTITQLSLQSQNQTLLTCFVKALDQNLPQITLDSFKNKITLKVDEIETTEAPENNDNNRFQYYRGILHNVSYHKADKEESSFASDQKNFTVIQLVGDNNARPLAANSEKLLAKSVHPKREKTFKPQRGQRKVKR